MLPEESGNVTSYQLEVPDELWATWRDGVPRSYSKLGDRITELIELDAACRERHGVGLVEYLNQHPEFDLDDERN